MTRRVFFSIVTASALSVSAFARNVSVVALTAKQKGLLLFMYQEEKVARDVYIGLGKKYPTAQTFSNILLSEQTHMDSVERLCIKYGVNIANVNEAEVGVFVLPELQALHDTLLAKGLVSLTEGLKVGVAIEEKDIKDLTEAMVGMPTDVVNVFTNLRNGSYSHLSAFQNALAALS